MFYLLKRIFYKIAWFLWEPYQKIFRVKREAVFAAITFGDSFLLIRNTYGSRIWTFPGGGIKKGETPEEAVRREINEEVGITLGDIKNLGKLKVIDKISDPIYCFSGETNDKKLKIDKGEIKEAAWFSKDNLPKSLSQKAIGAIDLYKKSS